MKIDFHAPYGALEKLLRNPGRLEKMPSANANNFEKLLSDIAPKSSSHSRWLNNSPQKIPSSSDSLQSAILDVPEPSPKILPSELQEVYPSKNSKTESFAGDVKTPTLLRMQRLEEAAAIPDSPLLEVTPGANPLPASHPAPAVSSLPKHSVDDIRASLRRGPMVAFEEIQSIVNRMGKANGIDPALGLAVIEAESGFDPRAVSRDGHASKGLMQLLDTTGKEILKHLDETGTAYNPFDPEQNVQLGVRYLRRLHDYFGEDTLLRNGSKTQAAANIASLERMAVAAFNAGEGRVASAQRRAEKAGLDASEYKNIESFLPSITQNYVKKVMSYRELHASRIEKEGSLYGEG
jgi:soluble lytic murein transglycosylase-like protein